MGVVVLGAGRGRAFAWVAAAVAGGVLLAGCSSGGGSKDDARAANASAPSAQASLTQVAHIAVTPADGAAGARRDKPITVQVTDGTLTQVTVLGEDGKAVVGKLSADALTWTSSGVLFPDTKYTVSAAAKTKEDKTSTASSAFTTVKA